LQSQVSLFLPFSLLLNKSLVKLILPRKNVMGQQHMLHKAGNKGKTREEAHTFGKAFENGLKLDYTG
jgi:hypothetical protein